MLPTLLRSPAKWDGLDWRPGLSRATVASWRPEAGPASCPTGLCLWRESLLLRQVNVLGSRSGSRLPVAGVAVMRLGLRRHEWSVRVGALEDMRTGLVSSASSGGIRTVRTVQPKKPRGLLAPISAATGGSRSVSVLQRSADER